MLKISVERRPSLAPGQRLASKAACLERLNPEPLGIIGELLWVVP
jgi:hypothetical protein